MLQQIDNRRQPSSAYNVRVIATVHSHRVIIILTEPLAAVYHHIHNERNVIKACSDLY